MSVLKRLGTPVFYAEGVPRGLTRENWRLEVGGLVAEPRSLSFADVLALPMATVNARLTSVSGWTVRADWQGARFGDFLALVRPQPQATDVLFTSHGGYTTSVPLPELRNEKVLICYAVGGEELEPEYGGPVRLFVPQLWGYKSIKGLVRMTFNDRVVAGFWEQRGYTENAAIEPEVSFDVNSGRRREIPGGEVTGF
ncbi:MAG: molybdopterin-dependent oxidoreductase [bacterium]